LEQICGGSRSPSLIHIHIYHSIQTPQGANISRGKWEGQIIFLGVNIYPYHPNSALVLRRIGFGVAARPRENKKEIECPPSLIRRLLHRGDLAFLADSRCYFDPGARSSPGHVVTAVDLPQAADSMRRRAVRTSSASVQLRLTSVAVARLGASRRRCTYSLCSEHGRHSHLFKYDFGDSYTTQSCD
jgi:hypothetical protein